MSGLEGTRKCSRWLSGGLRIWTVWGGTGRLTCHSRFQFEYPVKEHAKKRSEVIDKKRGDENCIPSLGVPISISLARTPELIFEVFVFLLKKKLLNDEQYFFKRWRTDLL